MTAALDNTAAVSDEIDELVDWQLANPKPGATCRRPIFHMIDGNASHWSSPATWSPENGWGHRCSFEHPAFTPDYWGPDPT